MSDSLNTGADWEQSKRLVIHWHNMWAKEKTKCEFVIEYLNPADTSFRKMIDTFRNLPKDQQDKLIDLTKSLAALSEEK